MTQGRRLPDDSFQPWEMRPGDYGKRKGNWWGCCPGEPSGGGQLTGNAEGDPNWTVTEHDDGTITASPSIHLVVADKTIYHGFLQAGAWTAG